MSLGEATVLTGKSGAEYMFHAQHRHQRFTARGGVFIMARAEDGGRYAFCFVGHTGDLSVRPLNREKNACFDQFRSDHILLMDEQDAGRRAQIVDDLVQAYMPSCNTI